MQARRRELFTTIRTEGAILPPDLLERIAAGDKDLGGLKPADYHLFEGEPLNEAIVRSWNRLVGAWAAFTDARDKLPEGDLGTTVTRERWLLILYEELAYGRLQLAHPVEIDGKSYAVSHPWGEHVPIHLVGCNVPLDRRSRGVAGAAAMSPHGLVQELLNRSDERLWGFVSNGLTLRVLRDNSSLTRQAYLEFDLASMMDGDVYADFVVLWLVCHQSRVEGEVPHECWLERWSQEAVKQGTRALDGLRAGVEAAISALGGGFLSHPANTELRHALHSGELDKQEYYRELLRLVYRLLFLFVAEDRGLLLDPDATPAAADRFDRFYSTQRLRRLADRRRGSKHADLYQGLRLVMEKLGDDDGCPALGLPALGSYLWSAGATPNLSSAELPNTALLDAVRALATLEEKGVRRAVDYRNLGAEELGSVYESLLELHPNLNVDAGTFALTTAAGNERKTTGSYYTPSSLISCLLDSAVDPVLAEAAAKGEHAVLDLKVVDPACGSGHFLVAAAHRIAKRLAALRTGDDEPSPEATRSALRDVVGRCLYGVDVNPMAVELCKVSLWMEALEPGKPLSFLDAHLKCGNSLHGTTLALIEGGIPDDAFKPVELDDNEIAASLRKQNKAEREGQLTLEDVADRLLDQLEADAAALEAAGDESLEALHQKERRFAALASSDAYERTKATADAWCSAFVQRKVAGSSRITTGVVRRIASGSGDIPSDIQREVRRFAKQYGLFHWEVEFPQVFGREASGFDVVLGNPPWEQVIFQEREFFAERSPAIAGVSRAAERRRLIESLEDADPVLYREYTDALEKSKGEQHFLRRSGVFPLSGVGRHLITGGLFVERARSLVAGTGSVGLIVPTEVATGDTLRLLFQDMIKQRNLLSLFDFENGQLFPGVHNHYKFSLLTLTGPDRPIASSTFVFYANQVADVLEEDRRFKLTDEEFALLNPKSRTCPIFRSGREARITKGIYRSRGVMGGGGLSSPDTWNLKTRPGLFNMALQSGLFRTAVEIGSFDHDPLAEYSCAASKGYLPLYEAKMIHQFDDRWASLGEGDGQVARQDPAARPRPRYWVKESEVASRARGRRWFLCYRDITNATNERTTIAAVLPAVGIAHHLPIVDSEFPHVVLAALNSCVVDFVTRTKVGGMHLTIAVLEQLPMDEPQRFREEASWTRGTSIAEWIRQRVLELSYTTTDLAPFARDLGYTGLPFRWDDERRSRLRAELDAAFFHLYGLAEDDVDYVMETFPIVKRRDEEQYGHYRTKALILDVYRKMANAIATGVLYETTLDPPPADTRVAHPPRDGEAAGAPLGRLRQAGTGDSGM